MKNWEFYIEQAVGWGLFIILAGFTLYYGYELYKKERSNAKI